MANEQTDPVVEDYTDSDSDSDSDSSSSEEENENDEESKQKRIENLPLLTRIRDEEPSESDNSPEANMRRFMAVLESRRMKRQHKEDDSRYVFYEDLFDFPKDREKWTEQDLQELWADAPVAMTKPGWDPVWADEDDWDVVRDEISAGRDPPIAPFYLPYRKPYPALPDNHYDISSPKSVVEELDRIEEFLKWVSYIFPDGSSYEGTVWDDLAHGKGVYVAEEGLVRYEGEWLQNNMEGHGVVEVDVPDMEPIPGSKLEAKMRAEGKIISRDFMTPEDRQWLEMDIEDSIRLADGRYEIPFYESNEWNKYFGSKPDKGRYRYAGQWKHGRMHGCGVYDLNERPLYGRFYFGEFVEDDPTCDIGIATMHAGIAEVAAAKARMFVNKPDGMIREQRGPFNDPIHPYFYEEEDVWMAPGFINQFYEVPDYWKTYTEEVDQERQMWLNSFYKAPLRLAMPAELEYWWSKDQNPEFVLINKEPEPDPKDPSKLIYTEDPLILHTKSGRLINYIEDEEHGIRLFWQPPLEEGEDVDPEKAQFLPLGFDEFYGREVDAKKETMSDRLIKAVENVIKQVSEKVGKWAEEKKKNSELKMKLIEHELDLVEAEICLEEEIEEMTAELKKKEKEEQKKAELDFQKDKDNVTYTQDEKASFEDVEEEEDVEDDDDEITPSSFGSIDTKDDQKGNKPGKSPFSSTSLSFPSYSLVSMVPSKIQQSFLSWKKQQSPARATSPNDSNSSNLHLISSISYPMQLPEQGCLRAARQGLKAHYSNRRTSQLHSLSRALCVKSQTSDKEHQRSGSTDWDNILSLHIPIVCNESCMTIK